MRAHTYTHTGACERGGAVRRGGACRSALCAHRAPGRGQGLPSLLSHRFRFLSPLRLSLLSSPPPPTMAFALRSAAPLRATTPTRPARKAAAPARALAGDGARVDRSSKSDVMCVSAGCFLICLALSLSLPAPSRGGRGGRPRPAGAPARVAGPAGPLATPPRHTTGHALPMNAPGRTRPGPYPSPTPPIKSDAPRRGKTLAANSRRRRPLSPSSLSLHHATASPRPSCPPTLPPWASRCVVWVCVAGRERACGGAGVRESTP